MKQRAAEKPNKLRYDKISSDRGKLRTACRRQRRRKKRGTRMNQKHIEDILSRIGISCGMNGYRYIVDALLLLDRYCKVAYEKQEPKKSAPLEP